MKLVLLISCVIWASQATSSSELHTEWTKFQETFGKSYRSISESKTRFSIFANNLKKIEEHNELFEKGEVSYTKGVNKFADWTTEEFLDYVNQYHITKDRDYVEVFTGENATIAKSIDWRTKGCITEVKDQGSCGSCWAFSTTGSLEAHLFLSKGELISLSEQNLIDCSWDYDNNGCWGGLMRSAFNYIKDNGIESETNYPYEELNGICRFNKTKSVVSVSGYVTIGQDEASLVAAVSSIGPLSVAIDATEGLQLYASGIFEDESCNPNALNHGVLLVGYGSENGKDYYIIKNSWGSAWGENGFFRLGKRGSNPCGIVKDASYPKVI